MATIGPGLKERIEQSFARQKLMAAYGSQISIEKPGSVTIRVPKKDFLLRTSGIFHGGVIAAIADTAAGYAAVSCEPVDASFLTVEFKISFLNKAKGDLLVARAGVLKKGRTLTVASVDLFVHTENVEKKVAVALVTLIKENK
jgi:uncharacterized protein (TIGR00369 family)